MEADKLLSQKINYRSTLVNLPQYVIEKFVRLTNLADQRKQAFYRGMKCVSTVQCTVPVLHLYSIQVYSVLCTVYSL